jgi:sugar phosphate isomerase/epimerase
LRTYSLDNLTVMGASLPELVEVAAAAGYEAICPWAMRMMEGRLVAYPSDSDLKVMADRLRDTGVRIAAGDGFSLTSGHDIGEYKTAASQMAELGAKNIIVLSFDPDAQRAYDGFCALCEHAKTLGIGVALECLPTSQVRTLTAAVAYVGRTGMDHVGLQVDLFHLMNGAGLVEELREIDRALIRCAQISDGRPGLSMEEYQHAMMHERLAPGDGAYPLPEFLSHIPENTNIGLEVPTLPAPRTKDDRIAHARNVKSKLDGVLGANRV